MFVDAHHHLWSRARKDYPWMSAAPDILRRDYLPAEFAPLLRRFGVERTVLVQAAPTRQETDFLLEIAERTEFVAGVVGWLDMEDENFPATLARYSKLPKFVGLRPMLQDLDDDAWILRPHIIHALKQVAESGVAFDFLTYPRHLPHVADALECVPDLRAVIDHLSKPPIATGEPERWREDIARVAETGTVHCKISGMITEADPDSWRVQDLRPFVDHVVEVFGPERLMFGSDWPVCRVAGEYGDVLAAAMAALPPELAHDRGIFGQNAIRFYGLPERAS